MLFIMNPILVKIATGTIRIAKISAKNALIPLQTMFYPLELFILELTNLNGT